MRHETGGPKFGLVCQKKCRRTHGAMRATCTITTSGIVATTVATGSGIATISGTRPHTP